MSALTPSHTIYHVYGRKCGCTKNLRDRKQWYRSNWGFDPIIRILEELYDKTDQEAGDIEWQYADKLGYRRGVHYTLTMHAVTSPGSYCMQTHDKIKVAAAKGGTIRAAKLSPVRRSMIARLGGFRRAEVLTPQRRVMIARLGGEQSKARRVA
jgi:hypothetical protein